jgi:hypothetical protein
VLSPGELMDGMSQEKLLQRFFIFSDVFTTGQQSTLMAQDSVALSHHFFQISGVMENLAAIDHIDGSTL